MKISLPLLARYTYCPDALRGLSLAWLHEASSIGGLHSDQLILPMTQGVDGAPKYAPVVFLQGSLHLRP